MTLLVLAIAHWTFYTLLIVDMRPLINSMTYSKNKMNALVINCTFDDHENFKRSLKEHSQKWNKNILTWLYNHSTTKLSELMINNIIEKNLKLWTQHTNLKIKPISIFMNQSSDDYSWYKEELLESVDLKFGFFKGQHGDEADFDGSGGVLAHAFLPPIHPNDENSGQVHFDEDENWTLYAFNDDSSNEPTYSFSFVSAHEIGHSLGLVHSNDVHSIMSSQYFIGSSVQLSISDLNSIQNIYGKSIPTCPTYMEELIVLNNRIYLYQQQYLYQIMSSRNSDKINKYYMNSPIIINHYFQNVPLIDAYFSYKNLNFIFYTNRMYVYDNNNYLMEADYKNDEYIISKLRISAVFYLKNKVNMFHRLFFIYGTIFYTINYSLDSITSDHKILTNFVNHLQKGVYKGPYSINNNFKFIEPIDGVYYVDQMNYITKLISNSNIVTFCWKSMQILNKTSMPNFINKCSIKPFLS